MNRVVNDARVVLQPHNGFIWNGLLGCATACPDACFNPTTGSSGTVDRATLRRLDGRLQPHNGFIWNEEGSVFGECPGCGFNPTTGSSGTPLPGPSRRPRRRFNPTTGSSGTPTTNPYSTNTATLQPHNGFIWNSPQQATLATPSTRFNPTTGSSGTGVWWRRHEANRWASTPQRVHLEPRSAASRSIWWISLQPHNGFIWNQPSSSAP